MLFWNLKEKMLFITSFNKTRWAEQHTPTWSNTVQSFQPNAHRHGKPPSQTKRFNGNSFLAWFSKLLSTQSFKLFSSNFCIVLYIQTQDYLKSSFKVDSPICSFCHNAEETLVHLFCECPVRKSFWNEISRWYSCISKSTITIPSFDICFGHNVHT